MADDELAARLGCGPGSGGCSSPPPAAIRISPSGRSPGQASTSTRLWQAVRRQVRRSTQLISTHHRAGVRRLRRRGGQEIRAIAVPARIARSSTASPKTPALEITRHYRDPSRPGLRDHGQCPPSRALQLRPQAAPARKWRPNHQLTRILALDAPYTRPAAPVSELSRGLPAQRAHSSQMHDGLQGDGVRRATRWWLASSTAHGSFKLAARRKPSCQRRGRRAGGSASGRADWQAACRARSGASRPIALSAVSGRSARAAAAAPRRWRRSGSRGVPTPPAPPRPAPRRTAPRRNAPEAVAVRMVKVCGSVGLRRIARAACSIATLGLAGPALDPAADLPAPGIVRVQRQGARRSAPRRYRDRR